MSPSIAFNHQELQKTVRLKTGTLTRANNIQRERNMTAALRPVQYKNSYYALIQFNKLPGKQQRQQLEKEGIVFLLTSATESITFFIINSFIVAFATTITSLTPFGCVCN